MIFKKSFTKIFLISLSFVFFLFNISQSLVHAQNHIKPLTESNSEMFIAKNDKITPVISQKQKVSTKKKLSPRKQLDSTKITLKTISDKKNWVIFWKYSNIIEKTEILTAGAFIITLLVSLLH